MNRPQELDATAVAHRVVVEGLRQGELVLPGVLMGRGGFANEWRPLMLLSHSLAP